MTVLSLLNPLGWFGSTRAKLTGGGQPGQGGGAEDSFAGKPVTAETALSLVTYWACVRIIAQTIGTLPMNLYQQSPDGSRVLALDNPLFDLLHDQPNASLTAVEFWEGVGACLAVWGNAYVLKQTIGSRLVALDLLRPFWMSVFRGKDGAPVYRYSDPLLGQRDYAQDDLFHVKGFGFGDFVGLSPLAFNRNAIGTAIATDEAAGSLFRNGLRIAGWFRYKGGNGILTAQQQTDARTRFDKLTGSGNTGRYGFLPGDFDWISTTMNPADAEMLNNRRLNVEEICRGFGVPPVMVGHSAQGQTMFGTGVDQLMLGFMTTTLRPYLHRIESAIGRDIIGREGRKKGLRASFEVEELLRGDNKGQALIDQSLANTGIMARNEIRARRGLPPKPGGDTLTVQSALLPIEMLGEVARLPRDKPVEPGADTDPLQQDDAEAGVTIDEKAP